MSDLTDEQRETLLKAILKVDTWKSSDAIMVLRPDPEKIIGVVAAMLADERAAREKAEARLAATKAATWALAEEHDRTYGDCYATATFRALVADGGALGRALDRARADAWDEGWYAGWDNHEAAVAARPHLVPAALNPYRAEGGIQTEADFDAAFNEATPVDLDVRVRAEGERGER